MRSDRKPRLWIRLSAGVLALILVANVSAFLHARAMTEFTATGTRTKRPEALGAIEKLRTLAFGVNVPRPENHRTPSDVGLAFKTYRYPSARGHTLETWHIPAQRSGTLVVIFHGYASSKDSLLELAKEFNAMGVSTLLVDFHGSGGSSGSGTSIGYREADDVVASLRYAESRWPDSRLILYGSSMGGAAVLRAIALERIEPDAVILESVFDRLVNTVANRFRAMGLPPVPLAQLLVFWGGWRDEFDGFAHNPSSYAREVSCPTLVLHGRGDRRVTEAEARAVHDALPGWKRYSEYPVTEHGPLFSSNPKLWRDEMKHILHVVEASDRSG